MYPILFSSNTTVFTTNGIGRLSDASSCYVMEERNGAYELELEYPMAGIHFSDLKNGNIIYAKPFQNGGLQAFRIYKVVKKAKDLAGIYARHITYQLSYIPVTKFSAGTAASSMSTLKQKAVEPCPFNLSAVGNFRAGSFVVTKPDSIRALLGGQEGSVLDTFHGEYEWDNWNVILHESRGSDKGVHVVYGKNLIDLSQEENIENTITGIYPYWQNEDYQEYDDDGNEVESIRYVELPEKVVQSPKAASFPFHRSITKDFTQEFDKPPAETTLRSYTNQFITENNIGVPEVSLDVNFINLFETPGYKDVAQLQSVNLCDTITVEFPKLGISVKSKVIKTRYDVLRERYDEVSIGDPKESFSGIISDQLKQITYYPTEEDIKAAMSQNSRDIDGTSKKLTGVINKEKENLTNALDRATGVMNSGTRGHVIINRNAGGWANEILILDNENILSAKNVIRINMNGIGFSSKGYYGPFYQAWTNDGHLTLGGVNNNFGDLELLDGSGKRLVELDKDGLYLYDTNGKTISYLTHNGLNIKKGEIELLWNNKVGFKVDGNEAWLGDFYVSRYSGRQVFQSSDERTGMSGQPSQSGGLYLWANWRNSSSYGLAVNSGGAYTTYKGEAFCIGEELYNFRHGSSGGNTCKSNSGGGGSCDKTCYSPCFNDCEVVCSGAYS